MNFCAVHLMGRLTRDVDLKQLAKGTVANFTVAVNRKFKRPDGGQDEYVSYFDCAAFGSTGETIARNFSKGRPIFVSGHLKQERWRKDEENYSRVRVIVELFRFIDQKKEDPQAQLPLGETPPP